MKLPDVNESRAGQVPTLVLTVHDESLVGGSSWLLGSGAFAQSARRERSAYGSGSHRPVSIRAEEHGPRPSAIDPLPRTHPRYSSGVESGPILAIALISFPGRTSPRLRLDLLPRRG
jgi:hypothetical protein